jgi:hypothetical protein
MKMTKVLTALAMILVGAGSAMGNSLTNGLYAISFRISDMGFSQVVTITNCTQNADVSYYKFDVVIDQKGSLKRFDDDNQRVKGIVYDGKFKFVIPYANVASHYTFYFDGLNTSSNGVFRGQGDVPYMGPNCSNNTFRFYMKEWIPIPQLDWK